MAIVAFVYGENKSNIALGIFLSAISFISIGDLLLSLTLHKNIAYSIINGNRQPHPNVDWALKKR